MSNRAAWFIGGMVMLVILSSVAPRIAGGIVALLIIVLAVELARKKLI